MPKISEPTVAAHRAHMEASLLSAAEAILIEEGPQAVTPSAVGAKVGLARNSVYEYFSSGSDLLGAVIEAGFDAWSSAVVERLAEESDPQAVIEGYARVTLELVAEGRHRAFAAVGRLDLPEGRRARIGALHEDLLAPLEDALASLDVPDAGLSARLIQGLVDAGTREIERGRAATTVIESVTALIRTGIHPKP